MPNPWRSELLGLGLAALVFLWVGWLFGAPQIAMVLFLLLYLVRHLKQLYKLEQWLRAGGLHKPPESHGIWEEIYYDFYRLKRRDKQRKKRLGKMLSRFRKATAALPDATAVLGADNEIVWFNKSAGRFLGLKSNDRGQSIGNFVRDPIFTAYLALNEYDESVTISSSKNPNLVLSVRIIPYGGGLRLLLAQDVTRFRQLQRTRRDFVANVSHEMRTPLTVIRGYLETLLDIDDLPRKQLDNAVKSMLDQSSRMRCLIDDLLWLTRLETKESVALNSNVDINPLLDTVCKEAKTMSGGHPKIELFVHSDADLVGNEKELHSAFSNLVVNAVKYSGSDASVTVTWIDDDKGVRLDVKDTGQGIAAVHIPRLTERFYRVDADRSRTQGGTGLGLAIVKHVLARHEAELEIESRLGEGSCFSCCFPQSRAIKRKRQAVMNLS